jgi:hypothetical protein
MVCSPSWADWKYSVETDVFTDYYDKSTIRRNGPIAKMWIMRDFSSAQTNSTGNKIYVSQKILMSFNCRDETKAVFSVVGYSGSMGSGDVVLSETVKESQLEYSPFSPGSVNEANSQIACGKK